MGGVGRGKARPVAWFNGEYSCYMGRRYMGVHGSLYTVAHCARVDNGKRGIEKFQYVIAILNSSMSLPRSTREHGCT